MQMQQRGDLREQPQQQADGSPHQGTVDADELQIFTDIELDLPRHIAGVPALHCVADMAGEEGGELRRHPVRRLLQVFVKRFAQRVVAELGFTEPLPRLGDTLLNT